MISNSASAVSFVFRAVKQGGSMIDDVNHGFSRSRSHWHSRSASLRHAAGDTLTRAAWVTVLIALPGCTVGPNYRTPAPPATGTYTSTPLPDQTASAPGASGVPQQFVAGLDIPAQWWTLYHCEP